MLLSTVIHKYINKSNYYSTAEVPRSCVRLSSENPGVGALYPVHRLDKQVSGVLLFARSNATTACAPTALIQNHRCRA